MPKWVAMDKELATTFIKIRREYSEIEAMFSLSLDKNCGKERSLRSYSRMWSWSIGRVKRFIEKVVLDGTLTEQQRNTNGTAYTLISLQNTDATEQQRNTNGTATEHKYKEQEQELRKIIKELEGKLSGKGNGRFNPYSLKPDFISDSQFNVIKDHRIKVKATNTERSWTTMFNQLNKAVQGGYTIDECIDEMSNRSWKGFKVDWMPKKEKQMDLY